MKPSSILPAAQPTGESELLTRARASEEAALRTIMQQNNRRLFRLARSIIRNDSEAEDIVQETYIKAFTHLEEFRGDSSLSTWLGRIALNEALQRARRQKPAVDFESIDENTLHDNVIPFPRPDPEIIMAQSEITQLVQQAIDKLPEPFRAVLVARVIEEMSVSETAELFKIPAETVKTRLFRARALLRDMLESQVGPALTSAFPFDGARCRGMADKVMGRLNSL